MRYPLQRSPGSVYVLMLAALLLLSGCVTTTESEYGRADRQQEIKSRVEAANAYLQKGNTEQAIVHLKRAAEIDPDDPSIQATMAQVFWRSGEYELADEHFQRALRLNPEYSRGRNNYAAFLYERRRYADAARELERVVADTLYEGRATAFMNLGKVLLKLDRTADAEEAFTRAVRMDGRQWQAMLELAELHYARGDYRGAGRFYDQFKRYAPSQAPESLLLGIRIARIEGDKNAEASYALQLKSRFPESEAYRRYQTDRSLQAPADDK